MGKQETNTEHKTELIKEIDSPALYGSANDEIENLICERIYSRDKYNSWYVNQFLDIAKYRRTLRALDMLVEKKYIIKVKACPVFYERIDNNK